MDFDVVGEAAGDVAGAGGLGEGLAALAPEDEVIVLRRAVDEGEGFGGGEGEAEGGGEPGGGGLRDGGVEGGGGTAGEGEIADAGFDEVEGAWSGEGVDGAAEEAEVGGVGFGLDAGAGAGEGAIAERRGGGDFADGAEVGLRLGVRLRFVFAGAEGGGGPGGGGVFKRGKDEAAAGLFVEVEEVAVGVRADPEGLADVAGEAEVDVAVLGGEGAPTRMVRVSGVDQAL